MSIKLSGGAQVGLGKLGGALSNCPEVRNLISTEVVKVLESLFGRNEISGLSDDIHNSGRAKSSVISEPSEKHSFPSAQIALRFPELSDITSIDPGGWHTDGYRRGKTHEFSVLLGICLSDCNADFMGNLLVWPCSHHMIHR